MAEGPGQKKKKKPQAQQKASAPPMPDAIQPSDEDVEAYTKAMQGLAPAGDTTGASTGVESGSSSTAPAAEGTTPPEHPVQGFWDRLVHGVDGTSRLGEIGRSVGRGALQFADQVSKVAKVAQAGAIVMGQGSAAAGLGDAAQSLATPPARVDRLLGKRSDDPIANFAEGATQFAMGWAALPEFKLLKGAGAAAKAVNALAKGATVDATAFDPYEAQLAELLAQAPVPGVRQLAKALSVKGDDSEIIARAKRAAAGAISGAVMEGLISSVKLIRAVKAGATEEAQAAAKNITAVAEGSHVAEGDHVSVVPAEGGKWTLKSLAEDPSAEVSVRNAAKDAEVAAKAPQQTGAPLDPEALKETQPLFDTLKDPNASLEAKAAAQAKLDELGAKGSQPYPEFQRGESLPEEVKQRMFPEAPVFADRAEAETQAAVMNGGLADRAAAGKVDSELTESTINTVKDFAESRSPEALEKLTDGGPLLGLSAATGPDRTAELVSRLSHKVADQVQGIVKEQGVVHVEQSFKIAKQAMQAIPLTEAPKALREKLGETLGQHVWELMGNATLKDLGERLAQMSDVLEARPNDVVAHEEGARLLAQYIDLQATLADHDSEIGRTLRIMQERENPLMDKVKAGEAKAGDAAPEGAAPAVSEEEAKIVSAQKEVAEAKKELSEAKIGPNTETVVDAADLVKQSKTGQGTSSAKAGKSLDIEKQGLSDGTRDTEGVNATDFSLSRARQRAVNAMRRAEEALGGKPFVDEAVKADNRSLRGERVKMQAEAQRENPLEGPDVPSSTPKNPIEELSRLLDKAEADLTRKLEASRKAPKPKQLGQKLPEEVSPFDTHLAETKRMRSIGEPLVAGMKQREIRATLRMMKMAGGAPRNAFSVVYGAQTIKETGKIKAAMEVFVNALLSGAQTAETVFASGLGLSTFEPAVRAVAGAVTANRALMREGADIMYGNFKYLWDNIQVAAAAARQGRSIINPAPNHIAIGGLTGEIVRIPSKILTGLDELTRVTNYRSYVRAKALRYGRGLGMSGPALEQYAEDTLRASFDPATGIATIPDALKYAEVPTLSGPLGPGLGKAMQNFTRDAWQGKLIVPFVKASAKVFDYVWQSTPGLNMFNREAREIMRQGGEQAAILHTRSALAGMLYGYGIHLALGGQLTGRGPADPLLRKLDTRPPYSIKVGDTWISYRRTDPLGMPLGLIADTHTVIQELGDKNTDANDMAYGVVASLVSNMANKTYLSGLLQFADAWGKGDVPAVKRWLYRQVSSVAVPQGIAQFNPDDTYREVRDMGDAILSRVPGFSEKLDPRFNIFGEPEMKSPGLVNRSFNMFTTNPAKQGVEDDLLQLRQGLAPMPQKLLGGKIDLTDKVSFDNGTGKSPWIRLMELVRHPEDGRPPLREAMEELVKSDKWKEGSSGTSMFPGGSRWLRAAAKKDEWEQRALKQVLNEYPKLKEQWKLVQRERGAAIRSGDSGVAEVEQLFGLQK